VSIKGPTFAEIVSQATDTLNVLDAPRCRDSSCSSWLHFSAVYGNVDDREVKRSSAAGQNTKITGNEVNTCCTMRHNAD
jgi:hypothetical protein